MGLPSRIFWAVACLLVAGGVWAAARLPPEPVEWRLFRSEEQRFQVLLPSAPTVSRRVRETWHGSVPQVHFEVELERALFSVERHDIPRMAVAFMPDQLILGRAAEGLLADVGGRLHHTDRSILHGHSARRILYDVRERPGWREEALLVLADARLFLAIAGRFPNAESERSSRRFFASFEIW